MAPLSIAIAGVGKIACDQHIPVLRASDAFNLVATVDPQQGVPGLPNFPDLDRLFAEIPEVEAVAICTPPPIRYALARVAIARGRNVLLEKPPCASLGAVEDLIARAGNNGVSLFAAWHSREAAGVDAAREWLARQTLRSVRVDWREDVRKWHPGQAWIWEPGGLGVFDPGINALSILTRLLPGPITLDAATLSFPEARQTPIAAKLALRQDDVPIAVTFDWRETGGEIWDIELETEAGIGRLSQGGAVFHVDDRRVPCTDDGEYPRLYARFAELVAAGRSDVDTAPLRIVADAFLFGRRETVAAFED